MLSDEAIGKGRSQPRLSQSGIHRVTVLYQELHQDPQDQATAAKQMPPVLRTKTSY